MGFNDSYTANAKMPASGERAPRPSRFKDEYECETTPDDIERARKNDDARRDGLKRQARITYYPHNTAQVAAMCHPKSVEGRALCSLLLDASPRMRAQHLGAIEKELEGSRYDKRRYLTAWIKALS